MMLQATMQPTMAWAPSGSWTAITNGRVECLSPRFSDGEGAGAGGGGGEHGGLVFISVHHQAVGPRMSCPCVPGTLARETGGHHEAGSGYGLVMISGQAFWVASLGRLCGGDARVAGGRLAVNRGGRRDGRDGLMQSISVATIASLIARPWSIIQEDLVGYLPAPSYHVWTWSMGSAVLADRRSPATRGASSERGMKLGLRRNRRVERPSGKARGVVLQRETQGQDARTQTHQSEAVVEEVVEGVHAG